MSKKSWDEFNRMRYEDGSFYGCVDKDGFWFDSSTNYIAAVYWCCMNAGWSCMKNGAPDFETIEEASEWMRTEGAKLGYSIIHSDMLRKMYEAGLIK
jgi:hypothetical protein